ncbi:MAG TPA: hypothetical protein VK540_07445 [Polyangiaceae bacterium]|nr:hypothetical protein [Polyangiaceae bacterium]
MRSHRCEQAIRGRHLLIGWIAMATVLAACSKDNPKGSEPKKEAPATAAAEPAPKAAPTSVDPLCLKYRDEMSKTIGMPITEVKDRVLPNFPLRCIYSTAMVPAMIEVGKSDDLAKERKGFELGGHPTDSTIGSGGFRTDFGGLRQVIGQKGTKRLAVGGPAEYPKLEALWQTVAAGL